MKLHPEAIAQVKALLQEGRLRPESKPFGIPLETWLGAIKAQERCWLCGGPATPHPLGRSYQPICLGCGMPENQCSCPEESGKEERE